MNESAFEERIGYVFSDKSLLQKALTHSSITNETPEGSIRNYERLEFLGDAVFDLVISEYLYHRMGDMEEGRLSKIRAMVVCERSLAERSKALMVGKELVLGRGEELNGGHGSAYRRYLFGQGLRSRGILRDFHI